MGMGVGAGGSPDSSGVSSCTSANATASSSVFASSTASSATPTSASAATAAASASTLMLARSLPISALTSSTLRKSTTLASGSISPFRPRCSTSSTGWWWPCRMAAKMRTPRLARSASLALISRASPLDSAVSETSKAASSALQVKQEAQRTGSLCECTCPRSPRGSSSPSVTSSSKALSATRRSECSLSSATRLSSPVPPTPTPASCGGAPLPAGGAVGVVSAPDTISAEPTSTPSRALSAPQAALRTSADTLPIVPIAMHITSSVLVRGSSKGAPTLRVISYTFGLDSDTDTIADSCPAKAASMMGRLGATELLPRAVAVRQMSFTTAKAERAGSTATQSKPASGSASTSGAPFFGASFLPFATSSTGALRKSVARWSSISSSACFPPSFNSATPSLCVDSVSSICTQSRVNLGSTATSTIDSTSEVTHTAAGALCLTAKASRRRA
mmetsp:Transcript_9553/g.21150  ORF Transcript_9553/g.21150 Transcript_9553/m.21150 type:complete len:448 (-) Transcript_9553:111-1454(-)